MWGTRAPKKENVKTPLCRADTAPNTTGLYLEGDAHKPRTPFLPIGMSGLDLPVAPPWLQHPRAVPCDGGVKKSMFI